jgi:hypothetical protein
MHGFEILGGSLNLQFSTGNKFFFMLFAIFGIMMPIGVQPSLQANYAFAEINLQSTVNQTGNSIENRTSSPLPTVETKPNTSLDTINSFDSAIEDENYKTKTDIIIPDFIELDIVSETKPDSNNSNESRDHLNRQISNPIDNDGSDIGNLQNGNDIVTVEPNGANKNNSNLTITETQMTNFQNDLNVKTEDRNPVTDDVPSSENLESKIDSRPINMSYHYYMDNSDANEDVRGHDNREYNELALMNSSINPYIGNESEVGNSVKNPAPNAGHSISVTDNQSEYTGSQDPNRKYMSYSDFVDKNSSNKNKNKTYISEEIKESESTSSVNNSTNYTTIKQLETNNNSIVQAYSSSAVSSISAQSVGSGKTYGDFNGDGKDDLAIGVPFEDVYSSRDAGAVQVIYGSSSGLSATISRADQFWSQDSPDVDDVAEEGDSFGRTLSSGDFNADGVDDLAIGVPDENQGNIVNSGGVQVIYGSLNGLSTSQRPDQFWTQESTDVDGDAELDENFGSSLSVGDFNGDDIDDLAVGVPREDIGTIVEAGGVQIIYGSPNGLSATSPRPDQFWTQDNPDIDGISEPADFFGDAISSGDFNGDDIDDLAVGIPGEDVGNIGQAGAAQVIYGSLSGLSAVLSHPDQFWSQDSIDIENGAEYNDLFGSSFSAGDYNGDGIDDLAIGVPAEGLGTIESAGAIHAIYGSLNGLSATLVQVDQFWTQDSAEIASTSGAFKNFGVSLSKGDFNGDSIDDLAIGVPGEDIGNLVETGAAQVVYGSAAGLSPTVSRPDQFWTQDTLDVNNGAEIDDLFGASISAGDFDGNDRDDLVVGVPAEDLGGIQDAGAVQVLYGSSKGVSATFTRPDQFWTQDTTDIAATAGESDSFGNALG